MHLYLAECAFRLGLFFWHTALLISEIARAVTVVCGGARLSPVGSGERQTPGVEASAWRVDQSTAGSKGRVCKPADARPRGKSWRNRGFGTGQSVRSPPHIIPCPRTLGPEN